MATATDRLDMLIRLYNSQAVYEEQFELVFVKNVRKVLEEDARLIQFCELIRHTEVVHIPRYVGHTDQSVKPTSPEVQTLGGDIGHIVGWRLNGAVLGLVFGRTEVVITRFTSPGESAELAKLV